MKKIAKSFVFAYQGIIASLQERTFKMHIIFAIMATVFAFYFEVTAIEGVVIVILIGMIFALEMINTAIEKIMNMLRDEAHVSYEKTGLPKDLSAGAVLVFSVAAFIIGLIIFVPYILGVR